MVLTLIMILCRNLLKNTQFRQIKEKPSLYVGFQVMSVFLPKNEKADSAAKDGLSLTVTALKSPAFELLSRVTKLIYEKW